MGKKLSAAQKQQISATLKRKWAEKKASLAANRSTATVEPFKLNPLSPHNTPRSSKEEAVELAVDAVSIVVDELSPAALVRLVDRILRP